MDAIIEDLQASDTKARVRALEALLLELRAQAELRLLESGKKLRLVNLAITTVKDANPKVVLLSLECVQLLVLNYKDLFAPSLNMTFDILLSKFGDSKETIRDFAKTIMLDVINDLGSNAGFERILSHLKHKNWKIREQLLHIIVTLLDIYGEEVAVTNDLTPQVASMLTDAQSSIRALVVDVLGRLYAIFGDVFMVELGSNSKIKPNHIRAIKEVAAQQVEGGLEISIPINRVDSGTGGSVSSVSSAQSSPGNISTGEGQNNRKPGIGKSKSDVARRVSGLGGTGRVMSLKSKESFSNTTGHMPSFSRNSSSNSVMSGDSVKDGAAFSPLWYLSLLSESKTTQTIYPSSEKDLARIFSGIIDEIKKQDDWQARVAGLGKLQALVTGICYVEGENGDPALKNALIDELKATPVSDLLCCQIVDLRSAVCKEACCTIATLARTLRNSFAPLAKLFISSLIKILTQKIYVIASAADRCLRIVMSSPILAHYPKVIDILIETIATSKNSEQKKKSFEYLTLAMAIWHFSDNMLDKMYDAFKKSIQDGVKDANSDVRKAARHLFWVLKGTPSYEHKMERVLDNMDASTRKHVNQELQNASEDFIELLNNPTGGLDDATTEYVHVTPFEGKRCSNAPASENVPLSSSLERPSSDQTMRRSTKNAPPPLPSQRHVMAGPGRVASSDGAKGKQSSRNALDEGSISSNGSISASSSIDELDSMHDNSYNIRDRGSKSTVGGARRTTMAPERVIRDKGDSRHSGRMLRQGSGEEAIPPAPLDMPPPAPPAVTISNSIRNKSAGRVALQSKHGRTIDSSDSREREDSWDSETTTSSSSSRPMKQTHSSGAQRIIVNQNVKRTSQPVSEDSKNEKSNVIRQSQTRGHATTATSIDTTNINKAGTQKISESSIVSQSQAGGQLSSHSVTEIRGLVSDSHWDKRVEGFEAINSRFTKWLAAFHDPASGTSHFPPYLEDFLDLCINHLSDSHQKVIGAVVAALETLCRSKPNPLISHRMSQLLSTLLTRLGDRKASVRSQANDLLDMIRESYDAPHIVAALSLRMAELPERTRLSLVQFIVSLVPLCESYFNIHMNMAAFLNRLVIVLGVGVGAFANSGHRASSTLLIAGQRLLELLFNVSKDSLLSQLAILPLQQQSAMKKMLEGRVPNIDALVAHAGRQEWISQAQSQQHLQDHYNGVVPEQLDDDAKDMDDENDIDIMNIEADRMIDQMSNSDQRDSSHPSLRPEDARIAELSKKLNSPFLSTEQSYNPSESEAGIHHGISIVHQKTPNDEDESPLDCHSSLTNMGVDNFSILNKMSDSSPLTPPSRQSDSNTYPTFQRTPTDSQKRVPITADAVPEQKKKDVVWLLNVLRPDGQCSSDEKKRAVTELKKWAKTAQEGFWRLNSAQIISVLLEAFNPTVFSKMQKLSVSNDAQQTLTGWSPPPVQSGARVEESEGMKGGQHDNVYMMEAMHLACKGLLILVKVEDGCHMEAFLELLVARLCHAASFAPVAISLHCEQILSLASALDPSRFAHLLLPFISNEISTAIVYPAAGAAHGDTHQLTRLLALHSLSAAVTHLKSADLIKLLPELTSAILPHFSSPLVDIRKSVVFVLVEVYMKVGDTLYPYVKDLAASQRKLLTVYIERQMNRSSSH